MGFELVTEREMVANLAVIRVGEHDEAIKAAGGLEVGMVVKVLAGEGGVKRLHGQLQRRVTALGLSGVVRVREGEGCCYLKRLRVRDEVPEVKVRKARTQKEPEGVMLEEMGPGCPEGAAGMNFGCPEGSVLVSTPTDGCLGCGPAEECVGCDATEKR